LRHPHIPPVCCSVDLRIHRGASVRRTELNEPGLGVNTWQVLTDSLFPSAKTADGIALAVRY